MSRNPFAFTRSPSQLRKFFCCPRKWFLSYAPGQRWRSWEKGAALIQGSVFHKVMELLLRQCGVTPIDPIEFFWWLMDGVGAQLEYDETITYGDRDSWAKMRQRGARFWGLHTEVLLELFACRGTEEYLPRLGPGLPVRLIERDIRYNQGWPERAIIDYAGPLWVRKVDGQFCAVDPTAGHEGTHGAQLVRALIDFKTVKYEKEQTAAELDSQLMSQQLALQSIGATVDVVGLLDLVAQQEKPHLQFLLRKPFDSHELGMFISDALYGDKEIMAGHFPMTGRWTGECEKFGGCEYKPLCFGSLKDDVAEKLYQEPNPYDADDLGIRLEDFD
jgi:hypothetical protein